ncbi:MAG: Crp/Fnr family transcriptional regulator [Bacteroidales bacterium]|nr:Crp/Fnr family transcriptional regulator [Bacteroidales bacterium]MCF8458205.1 Crp/Fnr family transcriptional regulator [Bacteroidales bacterium]
MIGKPENIESCFVCQNKSKCFRQLENRELEKSNKHKVQVEFKKGENIIKQGSFANHVFFIKKGLAKIFVEIPNAPQNLVLNILPQGYIMGLPSLYDSATYTYTATAIEDSTICMIENSIIRELVEKNGKFASELIKSITQCLRSNYNRFISLTQKQLRSRVADILVFLAEEIYQSPSFRLTLSYGDLAELTGMSKASVVKVIKEFKDSNLLTNKNGHYELLDLDELRRISGLF